MCDLPTSPYIDIIDNRLNASLSVQWFATFGPHTYLYLPTNDITEAPLWLMYGPCPSCHCNVWLHVIVRYTSFVRLLLLPIIIGGLGHYWMPSIRFQVQPSRAGFFSIKSNQVERSWGRRGQDLQGDKLGKKSVTSGDRELTLGWLTKADGLIWFTLWMAGFWFW